MGGPRIFERQKMTFERLAGIVSRHGWKDFEVSFESEELRIDRHGGRAACTIVMVPHESRFQAHFVFTTNSVSAISFTIGEDAPRGAEPAAAKSFSDIDEAAHWLLEFLETGGR